MALIQRFLDLMADHGNPGLERWEDRTVDRGFGLGTRRQGRRWGRIRAWELVDFLGPDGVFHLPANEARGKEPRKVPALQYLRETFSAQVDYGDLRPLEGRGDPSRRLERLGSSATKRDVDRRLTRLTSKLGAELARNDIIV